MRRDALVGAVLGACGLAAAGVGYARQSEILPDAPAAIQAFVREALSDRLRAGDIADLHAGGAANTSRIAIRADMPGIRMKLTSSALTRVA